MHWHLDLALNNYPQKHCLIFKIYKYKLILVEIWFLQSWNILIIGKMPLHSYYHLGGTLNILGKLIWQNVCFSYQFSSDPTRLESMLSCNLRDNFFFKLTNDCNDCTKLHYKQKWQFSVVNIGNTINVSTWSLCFRFWLDC